MNYYYSGLPYSGELYHHGIKGQKWGVRRFQNTDGSLTAAGRKRYSVQSTKEAFGRFKKNAGIGLRKAGEKISSASKVVGSKVTSAGKIAGNRLVQSFKKKHPKFMSDDELRAAKARVDMELSYKEAVKKLNSSKFSVRAGEFIADVAKRGAGKFVETYAQKSAEAIAKNMFKSKSEKLKERNARLQQREQLLVNQTNLRQRAEETRNINDSERLTRDEQRRQRADENYNRYTEAANNASNERDRRINQTAAEANRVARDRYERSRDTLSRNVSERSARIEARNNQMSRDGYTIYRQRDPGGGGSTSTRPTNNTPPQTRQYNSPTSISGHFTSESDLRKRRRRNGS